LLQNVYTPHEIGHCVSRKNSFPLGSKQTLQQIFHAYEIVRPTGFTNIGIDLSCSTRAKPVNNCSTANTRVCIFMSLLSMKLFSVTENHRDLRTIVDSLHANEGHCFRVGGCVRDDFLGLGSQNFDLEVLRLSSKRIMKILNPIHEIDRVGKSSGLFKIRGLDIDIGVPRREQKAGPNRLFSGTFTFSFS
jgi:hypothetical protein